MRTRFVHTAIALCLFSITIQALHAQPFRRRDLVAMAAPYDQLELRKLIMNYLTAPVIALHLTPNIHTADQHFLDWHRGYIEGLEAWLMTQPNGTKYVPLPKYDPMTVIPNAFYNNNVAPPSAVAPTYLPLAHQNPLQNLSALIPNPDPCPWTPNAFGFASNVPHNNVHIAINGSMGDPATASAAAIFWPWHAWLDDAYFYHQCNCWGARQLDLYMKDDVKDIGTEPNTTAPHNVYNGSPDIWVRNNPDPIVTGRYSTQDDPTHYQNPVAGALNFVYVRVRNKGCLPMAAGLCSLYVYWSCFSTGAAPWPGGWNQIIATPVTVPAIAVGEEWVAEIPWNVLSAQEPGACGRYCLLARLVSTVDPMTYAEGSDVILNTRNNNNIALRNVDVVPVDPITCSPTAPCNPCRVTQVYSNAQYDRINIDYSYNDSYNDRYGNGYNPVYVEIDLGRDLYNEWQKGGYESYGIDNGSLEDYKVKVTRPGAYLGNLHLASGQVYEPCVRAYVQNPPEGGYGGYGGYDGYGGDAGYGGYGGYGGGGGSYGGYGDYGGVYPVQITQYETYSAAEGPQVVGGATYEVRAVRDAAAVPYGQHIQSYEIHHPECPESYTGSIQLQTYSPNPDQYTYYWSNGASTRDVYNLAPGSYSVTVRDNSTSPCTVESQTYDVSSNYSYDVYTDGTLSHCYNNDGSATCTVVPDDNQYTYQWYQGGAPLPGQISRTLSNISAGTYSVEVRHLPTGCVKHATAYINDEWNLLAVDVQTTNASGPNSPDGTAHAIATGMAPFTYSWSTGQSTQQIGGLLPGTNYYVDVTDMGGTGCTKRTNYAIGYDPSNQPGGVETGEAIVTNTKLMPNPTSGTSELQYHLERSGIVQIELYDNVGRLIDVLYRSNLPVGDQTFTITTDGLASGQYSVRIVSGKATQTTLPLTVVH